MRNIQKRLIKKLMIINKNPNLRRSEIKEEHNELCEFGHSKDEVKLFDKGVEMARKEFMDIIDSEKFLKRISSIISGNYNLKATAKRDLIIDYFKQSLGEKQK